MTLRQRVCDLMISLHGISPELAAYHAERMDRVELRSRFLQYLRYKVAGTELSVAGRNLQGEPDFYQVFGFATATARLAAFNPVPELPTEQQSREEPARAGEKKPGPMVVRAVSASH